MKQLAGIILFFLCAHTASLAQVATGTRPTTAGFKEDLKRLAQAGFPEARTDSLYLTYNHILFWFNQTAQLAERIRGGSVLPYPLRDFREDALYVHWIDILLADTTYHKNTLGCFLACAANDTSKIRQVIAVLERSGYTHYWAAVILVYLGIKDIDPFLQFILANKDDPNMTHALGEIESDFFNLAPSVLDKFGRDSLFSQVPFIRYLATKSLAVTPNDPEKDAMLREAVLSDDTLTKGWVIAVLGHLRAGNLLPIVASYLQDKDLREATLKALANSPTPADRKHFTDLADKEDTIFHDILRSLYNSNDKSNLLFWLKLLSTKPVKPGYYFLVNSNTLLTSDEMLSPLQEALGRITDPGILYILINALKGRTDELSLNILQSFMAHDDQELRSRAGALLKENQPSPGFESK